ncbi:alpha/beta fold hydrolase [Streptomyces sp. NBC_01384]|uniref:alpha/beta fold hydrolase n=1 Tax=Streptomyces sp. NBC_01384 TaxID=2903847 RepID=UPI003865776E
MTRRPPPRAWSWPATTRSTRKRARTDTTRGHLVLRVRDHIDQYPSWGLVATADHTINPDAERYGYQRAGMKTVEVDSSHLVMLAHPERVAQLIEEAVRATAH